MTLDEKVESIYKKMVSRIAKINIYLERNYFQENRDILPMQEILIGSSYEDVFQEFKRIVKKENENDIELVFTLLQEYFLFSYGHDMTFKHKIMANRFNPIPIKDLIYPRLLAAVKEKFNDVSIMPENPNYEKNLKSIEEIMQKYMDASSLLFLLYHNDFQFPDNWRQLCPDYSEEVLEILKKSNLTIGDFLHALIDYKCNIINEILNEIQDITLRNKYLEKLNGLSSEQHQTTNTFAHVYLPIDYFLNHSFLDFLNEKKPSSIIHETPIRDLKK